MRDPIEQLLQEADRKGVGSPSIPDSEMAQRVAETVRRRRRLHRQAMFAGLLVAAFSATLLIVARTGRLSHPGLRVGSASADRLLSETTNNRSAQADPTEEDRLLQAQIDAQERLIDRMLQAERNVESRARLAEFRMEPTQDEVVERAATAVLFQADRLLDQPSPGLRGPAIQALNEVIEQFPQTTAAGLARRRIADLKKEG